MTRNQRIIHVALHALLAAIMLAPIFAAPVMHSGKTDAQLIEARAASYWEGR